MSVCGVWCVYVVYVCCLCVCMCVCVCVYVHGVCVHGHVCTCLSSHFVEDGALYKSSLFTVCVYDTNLTVPNSQQWTASLSHFLWS